MLAGYYRLIAGVLFSFGVPTAGRAAAVLRTTVSRVAGPVDMAGDSRIITPLSPEFVSRSSRAGQVRDGK
ncbi:MAG: hypothetical protein ACREM3_09920 [Candidatus Rokuibacteriota bacterium]